MNKTWLLTVLTVTAFGFPAAMANEPKKSPAEWVALLSSDRYAEREAASEHLLKLGSQAREDVRRALDSPDAEAKFRARELWKTLRWLVVPEADADIAALLEDVKNEKIDEARWREFVDKHGPSTLRLIAELRAADRKREMFLPGLRLVIEKAAPLEVARIIADAEPSRERAELDALLDEIPPADASTEFAVRIVQIHTALWRYEQAFNYGREVFLRMNDDKLIKECAVAVDRGKLFNEIEQQAREQVASETDAARLCSELSFYIGLFSALRQREHIAPLCDLAQKADPAMVGDAALRLLVEKLLKAKMPDRAVKMLRNARSPLAFYLRSVAHSRLRDEPAAAADWREAGVALNKIEDEKKEETCYSLADLMGDWRDERAEAMWQKILETEPQNSVYDANACFRLASLAENKRQFARAADLYEKGLAISKTVAGVLIVGGGDAPASAMPEDTMREKIKKLRARATPKNL